MSTQPPTPELTPVPPPTPTPSQSSGVLQGFLVSCGISAGIAILGVAGLALGGFGALIIAPYAVVQLAWTLPLFFNYRRKGQRGEAKGVLISLALNIVLSVACWGAVLSNLNFH